MKHLVQISSPVVVKDTYTRPWSDAQPFHLDNTPRVYIWVGLSLGARHLQRRWLVLIIGISGRLIVARQASQSFVSCHEGDTMCKFI